MGRRWKTITDPGMVGKVGKNIIDSWINMGTQLQKFRQTTKLRADCWDLEDMKYTATRQLRNFHRPR